MTSRRYSVAPYGISTALLEQGAADTLTTLRSVAAEIRAQLGLPDARPVRGRAGDRIRAWLAVRGLPTDEMRQRARGAA